MARRGEARTFKSSGGTRDGRADGDCDAGCGDSDRHECRRAPQTRSLCHGTRRPASPVHRSRLCTHIDACIWSVCPTRTPSDTVAIIVCDY